MGDILVLLVFAIAGYAVISQASGKPKTFVDGKT